MNHSALLNTHKNMVNPHVYIQNLAFIQNIVLIFILISLNDHKMVIFLTHLLY